MPWVVLFFTDVLVDAHLQSWVQVRQAVIRIQASISAWKHVEALTAGHGLLGRHKWSAGVKRPQHPACVVVQSDHVAVKE